MKKDTILLFVVFLLVTIPCMLIRELISLDELWNYNFARNMAAGLLPYKDFNIIQMPLFPFIVSIALNLFGGELIITRFVSAILFSAILLVSYKILSLTTKNKWASIIGTLTLLWIYKYDFLADYNFAVLFIILLTTYFELKNNQNKKILKLNLKYDILIGVLLGFAILTKQTTGLVLAFVCVMYKWIMIRKKEDILLAFKISLFRGIGVLIPLAVFIIYLLGTGSFAAFIDYCVLGISTFSNSFTYAELLQSENLPFRAEVLSYTFPIMFIITIVAMLFIKNRETKKALFVLFIFSLQSLIVMYPLADPIHMMIGVFPILVTMVYLFIMLTVNKLNDKYNITRAVAILLIGLMLIFSFKVFISYSALDKITDINKYYGLKTREGIYNEIKVVTQYIKEQEEKGVQVFVIDIDAVLLMIPLEKQTKYDMLLNGNLGLAGQQGIIDKIEQEPEGTIFLVSPSISGNKQSTEEIKNYIKENYKCIGSVYAYGAFVKEN